MKKLILICLVIIATFSCRKIFPIKNKNKVSVVNTANYGCTANIRLDGGDEVLIERDGSYTFENVTTASHTVTLKAVSPCVNYSSGNSCTFEFKGGPQTKTITITNTSGAQVNFNCN
jgi:hypothetical protein